jgi:hypothetical protein
MINMSKRIEYKLNKIIENSDPQELEDKIIKYTNEAIDDVMLNGNKNNGLENMRTSAKFFEDHTPDHPINFGKASYKIISHLLLTLSENYRDIVISNQKMQLFISIMAVIDLMSLNNINRLITNYKKEKNELYLKNAQVVIDDLKRIKIAMLDNENFPDALVELEEMSKEYPEYDEMLHKEFTNEVKKDIKDSKSDKKNLNNKG